jgi:hypothetical protein
MAYWILAFAGMTGRRRWLTAQRSTGSDDQGAQSSEDLVSL